MSQRDCGQDYGAFNRFSALAGKSRVACPALFAKIFPFSFDANHFYVVRIPAQHRGAFRDRHERRAGDAMDAGGAKDESADLRTAKSCGPDAPTLASSVAEVSARRRWQTSPVTGESAKQPLKPSRAGMPGD